MSSVLSTFGSDNKMLNIPAPSMDALLVKQARESHELTDAQRAARGLGLPATPPGKDTQSGPGGAPVGQPWQVHA
jgi:hypothetical protein